MSWEKVASKNDIEVGSMLPIVVAGNRIALYNVDGNYFATANVCTHDNAVLTGGCLSGKEIECPWHGAKFDVTTGQVTALPAAVTLKTYTTKIEGEDIFINLED